MVLQPKILHLSLHESIDLLYVVKFFFDHRGVQNRKISNTASKKASVINFHPFYISSTMFVKNWVVGLNGDYNIEFLGNCIDNFLIACIVSGKNDIFLYTYL